MSPFKQSPAGRIAIISALFLGSAWGQAHLQTGENQVTFQVATGATLGTPVVFTEGVPSSTLSNPDFKLVAAKTSCQGAVSGNSCTVSVQFDPQFSGLRRGAVKICDASNNVVAVKFLDGSGTGSPPPLLPAAKKVIYNAGAPRGLAVDGGGTVFFVDSASGQVFKAEPGQAPKPMDLGVATNSIFGLALDGAGNLYVADAGNNRILKLPYGGSLATAVNMTGLKFPEGVAVDGAGNLFVANTVAPATNGAGTIIKVDAASGAQSTVISEGLGYPSSLALDAAGDLFVADWSNNRVVELPASGGPIRYLGSGLNYAPAVALDAAGNVYIADQFNDRVVEIAATAAGPGTGAQTTVVTSLSTPYGLAIDGQGHLYIANAGSNGAANGGVVEIPSADFTMHVNTTAIAVAPGGKVDTTVTVNTVAGFKKPITLQASAMPSGLHVSIDPSPVRATGTAESISAIVTIAADSKAAAGTFPLVIFGASGTEVNTGVTAITVSSNRSSQSITFNPVASPAIGSLVTLSATATSGLPVMLASSTPGVCSVSANVAHFAAPGTCTITASQTGNGSFSEAKPVSQSFTVGLRPQAISFAPIAAQKSGASLNLNASANSGLAVSYASANSSVCSVTGSTATFLKDGICTIVAAQPGNETFAAAPPATQSFIVSNSSQTQTPALQTATSQAITFTSIPPQTVGKPLALSANSSSGLMVNFASSTVPVCTVEGGTVAFHKTGTCTIVASQPGNGNYGPASVSQTFNVAANLQAQSITFPNVPAQTLGQPLTLSATASSGLPVEFASSTASVCAVSGKTATFLSKGTCKIIATQTGNGSYSPVFTSQSFPVAGGLQAQSVNFPNVPKQKVGTPLNLSATSTSGLPVAFSSSADSVCKVSGTAATFSQRGNCTIIAMQSGNSSYSPAFVSQTFQVDAPLQAQTVNFPNVPKQTVGKTLNLSATSTSGLPVAFSSSADSVCKVSGTAATFSQPGNCTIIALQSGNGNYSPASISQTFHVDANLQTQTVNFPNVPKQTVGKQLNLSATSTSGLPVAFSSSADSVCKVSGTTATFSQPGNCTIVAMQSGNSSYSPAFVSQTFQVDAPLQAQTVNFPNVPKQTVGKPLNLSATSTSGLPVAFSSSADLVCKVSGTTATFSRGGNCTIIASQAGNGSYSPAFVSQTFHVDAPLQAQTVNFPNVPKQTVGKPLNLSATSTSGLPVAFSSSADSVCKVSGTTATFSQPGNCTIVAMQSGNSSYTPASISQTFHVDANLQTQIINFPNVPKQTVGKTLNLSATSTSGLPINFSSSADSVCKISGTTATFSQPGNCTVVAFQVGNSSYSPAFASQTFQVAANLQTQTINFPNVPPQTVGKPLNLSATSTSGLPVSFISSADSVCKVSGATATFAAPGNCTIIATQAGSSGYAQASASQTFPVGESMRVQTINFPALPKQMVGTTANLTAAASSGLPVSFSSTTKSVCSVMQAKVTFLSAGICELAASQPGNSSFSPASASQAFPVNANLQSQTITFAPVATQTVGTQVALNAAASSKLPVAFTSANGGVCKVSGNTATFVSNGTCTLIASQSGNSTYSPVSATQTFQVNANAQAQTITFTPLPSQTAGTSLKLNAIANSGLPVTFTSLTNSVCTVSGSTATLLSSGTCTIAASQQGDGTIPAANSATQSFTVSPAAVLTGLPLITAQSLSTLRNNFTGFIGMEFTVGPTPISVYFLGRMAAPGNNGTHVLKIADASTGTDVPGGSVTISMNAAAGEYQYAPLPLPVRLKANTAYYLMSEETANGDRWYDMSFVTAASVAGTTVPVYIDSTNRYVPATGLTGESYVPVNLLYGIISPNR